MGARTIAAAWRSSRIDQHDAHGTLVDLATLWSGVARVHVDDDLAGSAASMAVLFGLRGYDAVHLAASVEVGGTLVAAERALLGAARLAGLATIDVGR